MSTQSPAFSVIIPTYNREALLKRAIGCVLTAARRNGESVEILVVDDASPAPYAESLGDDILSIRTFRMERNGGPGPARNLGIQHARAPWAMLLDDDDLLLPDAFTSIRSLIRRAAQEPPSPVLQIARSNAALASHYMRVTFSHFLNGSIAGDWVPIVDTARFRALGLAYPETRIGGENLLWFRIARDFGMPTLFEVICNVTADAQTRLCSVENQLRNATAFAELQESTLHHYGEAMRTTCPAYYRTKVIGAAVYRILAGQRAEARQLLRRHSGLSLPQRAAVTAISHLPDAMVVPLFRFYRKGMAR